MREIPVQSRVETQMFSAISIHWCYDQDWDESTNDMVVQVKPTKVLAVCCCRGPTNNPDFYSVHLIVLAGQIELRGTTIRE